MIGVPSLLRAALCLAATLVIAAGGARAQDLPGQRGAAGEAASSTRAAGPEPGKTFVMSAFNATSQDKLSLFTSTDGVSYTSLASETWQPPQGLLRDPSITRGADGVYWLVYTTGWSGQTFGVARSADLRRWQHVADIRVPLPGLTNVWAPEWFRDADGTLSVIVSMSSGGTEGPFRAYHLKPTAADFSAFGVPRLLQGLDRNPIDTFVIRQDTKDGARYVAFAKNETTKFVERATATSLDGPWVYDRTGDWAGWGGPVEGQALVPVQDAQGRRGWRIFLDSYMAKRYRYSDSFDGLQTWTPLRDLGGVSGAVRHFTVLAEDTVQLQRATAAQGQPHTIAWDRHSLLIDGQRQMVFGAEFHPFRLPSPGHWRDVLQKFKALGLNTVSIYFSWGYHSAAPGHYDFTGVRNVERVLQMAQEEGLYVIARPGPYVNGELTRGGFPGWVARQRAEARTDAPEYQNAAAEWLTQINAIIARHQLTNGGGSVIAYQLENELFSVQPKNARHMQFLADKARADGITVPLFHNAASRLPDWAPVKSAAPWASTGPTDLYAFDGYPGGVCSVDSQPGAPSPVPDWGLYATTTGAPGSKPGAKTSPHTPGFLAEVGGGWFDYWGSNGLYDCLARRLGSGFQRVVYGANLINGISIQSIYMGYGGTSWGWQPAPVVFTSYDYGAPIAEDRHLREKALSLKLLGHFVQAANPVLAQMDIAPAAVRAQADNPRVRLSHNINAALRSHVLYAVRQPVQAGGSERFGFEIDTGLGRYRVPQQGTLQIAGHDAKLLLAAYAMERQQLVYATSELQTHLRQGERDLALLHGRSGEDGETVLRYASRPSVQVLAGEVAVNWDAARGDLRLNYAHRGLLELQISGGGRAPLSLLIADEPTAQAFWRLQAGQAGSDALLVHGPALMRGASRDGDELRLRGDTTAASALRVWAGAGVKRLRFNDTAVSVQAAPGDSLRAATALPGPAVVKLPDLRTLAWTRRIDDAETRADFDDSRWRNADARSSAAQVYTANENGTPVLAMSDYGFHHGDVWYRGRFKLAADAGPQQLELQFGAGGAGFIQVWLDGRWLGQHELDTGRSFPQTTGSFKRVLEGLPAGEHLLAVMVRNNSHNWDLFADDAHKEARGLIAASLGPRFGARHAVPIAWKIQGNQGGEDIADLVRGPYNSGGLRGERLGWHLPAAADRDLKTGWERVAPDAPPPGAGTYWLRSSFRLDEAALPPGHDVQLGLDFGDVAQPRSAREQRVLIFLNGWNVGQFISHIGPQRRFVLPAGMLHPNAENTLALAVTTDGQPANALELPRLVLLQAARGGLPFEAVPASRYLQRPAL